MKKNEYKIYLRYFNAEHIFLLHCHATGPFILIMVTSLTINSTYTKFMYRLVF